MAAEPIITYDEFCDDPFCQKCNRSMDLNEGCDWPEDPRLWLCSSCIYDFAESLLPLLN